jgi:hypothetical protein
MAADIYTIARNLIGDSASPYDITDLRLLKYLDKALDKLSELTVYRMDEDYTITSTDISNGYFELSHEVQFMIEADISLEYIDWSVYTGKKIRLIDPDDIAEGEYNFKYKARYKKFDGEIRENSYFDYPREADLAVVFYALGLYQEEQGVIDKDGTINLVASKSEEGLSVSYPTSTDLKGAVGNPERLKEIAVRMMRNLPSGEDLFLSVQA